MSKTLYLKNQLLESKGAIPEGMAAGITYAAILERGTRAFYEGYYGADLGKAISAAKSEQAALDVNDAIIEDLRPMLAAYEQGGFMATHTTSDFPLALASLRQRTLRGEYEGRPSTWREWGANVRTVPDFRPIRSISFGQMPELLLRPEGTDVKYVSFTEAEAGYRVANYERAIKYTWEMWLADDIAFFESQLRSLGRAARRTEALIIIRAIYDGVSRSAESGVTTGAPTITNVSNARVALSQRTFTDEDGNDVEFGLMATDAIFGIANADAFAVTLRQQTTDGNQYGPPNLNLGITPHLEPLWGRVFGTDWVLYDRNMEWLEVAFLEGFQGGPKTYTQLPDVREHPSEGSFANHSLAVKMGHTLGAKVVDVNGVIRVQGA